MLNKHPCTHKHIFLQIYPEGKFLAMGLLKWKVYVIFFSVKNTADYFLKNNALTCIPTQSLRLLASTHPGQHWGLANAKSMPLIAWKVASHFYYEGYNHSICLFFMFVYHSHFSMKFLFIFFVQFSVFQNFFLMWTVFKVFVEFVTILLLLHVLLSGWRHVGF